MYPGINDYLIFFFLFLSKFGFDHWIFCLLYLARGGKVGRGGKKGGIIAIGGE